MFDIPNKGTGLDNAQSVLTETDLMILAGAQAGYGIESGFKVTPQGTPGATVAYAAGTALFGTTRSAGSAGNTAAFGNKSSTGPRIDMVVVDNAGAVSIIAGTPVTPDPDNPPVPALLPLDGNGNPTRVALAFVLIPQGTGAPTIDTGNIIDKRAFTRVSHPLTPFDDVQSADTVSAVVELAKRHDTMYGAWNVHKSLEEWADYPTSTTYNTDYTVVVIGDSTSQGLFQAIGKDDWAHKVRRWLQEQLGTFPSYGWVPYFNQASDGVMYWTVSGGTEITGNAFAPWGRYYQLTGAGQTMTLNGAYGDYVDIYYLDNSATTAGATYKIDGGTATALTTANANDNVVKVMTIAISQGGKHAVQILGPTTSSLCVLGAFARFAGTPGVKFFNLALGGQHFSDIMSPSTRMNILDVLKPDLAIVSFGLNENFDQLALNTFESNGTALLNKLKGLTKKCDVLVWGAPQRQTEGGAILQASYTASLKKIAEANNCAFLDFRQGWGGPTYQSAYSSDGTHPNKHGYARIAADIVRVLQPSRLGSRTLWAAFDNRQARNSGVLKGARKKRNTYLQVPNLGPQIINSASALTLPVSTNRIYFVPVILLGEGGGFTTVSVQVQTAAVGGSGGSTGLRVAVYADAYEDAQWPGDKLFEGGQIDLTSTGVKDAAFFSTYPAGLFWLAFAVQSIAFSTAPILVAASGNHPYVRRLAKTFATAACYTQDAGYAGGAMPATAAPDGTNDLAPAALLNLLAE